MFYSRKCSTPMASLLFECPLHVTIRDVIYICHINIHPHSPECSQRSEIQNSFTYTKCVIKMVIIRQFHTNMLNNSVLAIKFGCCTSCRMNAANNSSNQAIALGEGLCAFEVKYCMNGCFLLLFTYSRAKFVICALRLNNLNTRACIFSI